MSKHVLEFCVQSTNKWTCETKPRLSTGQNHKQHCQWQNQTRATPRGCCCITPTRRGGEPWKALTQVVHRRPPTTVLVSLVCTSSRTLVAATQQQRRQKRTFSFAARQTDSKSKSKNQVQNQAQAQAITGVCPGVYQVALSVAPDTLHRCVGVAWGALICFPPNGGGALDTFAHHAQHPRDV